MSSVASASVAEAVMPTAVLSAAFSATVLAVLSASLVAPMSTSSTSVRVSVKVSSAVEPSVLVARTVTVQVSPASRSRAVVSATVTTPVVAWIARARPRTTRAPCRSRCSWSRRRRWPRAVIPTVWPLAMPRPRCWPCCRSRSGW